MKSGTEWKIRQVLGRLALPIICAMFAAGGVYGQSGGGSGSGGGSCTVTQLRLTIATADDDLRGGQDNLNIIVYFANSGYQLAPNVNHSQNWPNNSTNTIAISLNRPASPNQILGLRLVHIPDGGFNLSISPELATLAAPFVIAEAFQSPDNWNMGDIEIAAIGNGFGAQIGHHGFHRFTGSDPTLSIPIQAPAGICGSGSGGGSGSLEHLNPALNPGGSGLRSLTGANGGSKYGTLTNNDVVKMAKAGVPESTIVASIRSNPTQFDMSAGGVAKLRQIGISENILREMQNRSTDPNNNPKAKVTGNGGKNADDLNPQPYPPKSKTGSQTLLPSSGQQTMLGTQANSPSASANQSALIPAVRPAITDGTIQGAITGNGKTALTDGTVTGGIRPASTPAIGASQTMSASGNVLAGTAAQPPASIAVAAAAPNGKPEARMRDPRTFCKDEIVGGQVLTRISTVDGENVSQVPLAGGSLPGAPIVVGVFSGGPVFTPGKHYVIHGCGFGAAAGQVFIWGNNNFRVKLYPQQWSDQWIDAVVDPTASGPAQPVVLAVLTAGTTTVRNDVIGAGVGEATAFAVSFAPNAPTQADTMGSRSSIANVTAASQARTSANALTNPAQNLDVRQTPEAIRENPNVFVAQACAANSAYRVLSISGLSGGNSLDVGSQYTIYGCSFGNPPQVKSSTRPVRQSSQTGRVSPPTGYYVGIWVSIKSQFTGLIYGQVQSWRDNAIVVTFPASLAVNDSGTSLSGPAVATQLWLTRGDGQTTIYGPEGGLYFKPAN